MSDLLKSLLRCLKIEPKYLFGLAIVCLVVAGLPKVCREYLGYYKLVESYRGWINLVGIASFVYAFVLITLSGVTYIWEKLQEWRLQKNAPKILRELADDEKGYIAKYIKQNVSSLEFGIDDGVINGLELKGIVYRPVSVGTYNHSAFNLRSWVIKAIDENPSLKRHILEHYSVIL